LTQTNLAVTVWLDLSLGELQMRKLLITTSAVLALSAMAAQAGGLGEPIMEPDVVEEATSSSAAGIIVPILLILLIAAAASGGSDAGA
jgi:hypothetical protein